MPQCRGGLNGITNTLLATVEPGQEVVLFDPIYAGLVNRVLLAGGVPRYVPSRPGPGGWTTDPEELAAAIGPNTAAVLLMGPAMPTGASITQEHLDVIAQPLEEHGAWVVYDAAMARIRFDGRPPLHPAADYPRVRPDGGWSLLVDTRPMGLTAAEASQRLFDRARVAATPMTGWGPHGENYLRLVFANEPVERLTDLRERFDAAFA